MSAAEGLTVFIPVYNEQALLVPNIMRLLRYLEPLGVPYEIIIGSNGSNDQTKAIAQMLADSLPMIRFFHIAPKGVGMAFQKGIELARFDRIVTMDMDLSINPAFIRTTFQLLERYDMVVGSKIAGGQKRPLIRKAASNVFIYLAKILLRIKFHDYSIAAKGYCRAMVLKYLPYIDDKTFYVVQIVYRAQRDGRKLVEVPVYCHDTRESRFNLIHEGIYKFGNLLRLWFNHLIHMKKLAYQIKAVLFDFDGTLTRPGAFDFNVIRQSLGCAEGTPVLEYIDSLPTAEQKAEANKLLQRFEIEGAQKSQPHDGAEDLICHLRAQGIYIGIITRNRRQCVELALQNFKSVDVSDFDLIISRDDPINPKPSSDGVLWAAAKLNVEMRQVLMVGDFIFDIQAGKAAGALTVLLDNQIPSPFPQMAGDFTITHLAELKPIIRAGLPRPGGN